MEPATIAAVIEKFGAYSASLEREYIRSQQRSPEAKVSTPYTGGAKGVPKLVAAYLSTRPGWHLLSDIAEAIQTKQTSTLSALTYWRQKGKVDRQHEVSHRLVGMLQRYRWVD